jgi:hypothetical protein
MKRGYRVIYVFTGNKSIKELLAEFLKSAIKRYMHL